MSTSETLSTRSWKALSLAVLAAVSLTACETDQATATFHIFIDELVAPATPGTGGKSVGRRLSALSSPGSVSAQAFSYTDVAQIRIDVQEVGKPNPLYRNYDLLSTDTGWTGSLPFLPKDKALTFFARASKADGTLLFSGTTEQTLTANNQTVVISLSPDNDGDPIVLPRIKRISIPSEFVAGQAGNISFSVEARTGERLTYEIITASGGGTFFPVSGAITLQAIAGTFVSQYAPPSVGAEQELEHTVKVTNEAGHSVLSTFKTKVKPPGSTSGVRDTALAVRFNPVINALSGQRLLESNTVIWTASVADDGAAGSLTYAWSFTLEEGSTHEQPTFADATLNPATLQGYTTELQGELKLEVTDADGGRTTLIYPITRNQFLDNPIVNGPLTGFNSIRAGENHTCVLFNNGTARCWGRASSGQLGYGNTFNIGAAADKLPYTAGDVAIDGTGTRLTTGSNHTCVLLNSGFVRCWGANTYGQLGYNTTESVGDGEAVASYGYVNLGGNAVKVVAGYEHTCALMDTKKVRCWGRNNYGQLGYGNTQNVGDNENPFSKGDVEVGGLVKDIVAGGYHTCALMETGKVRCWGYNGHGELGYGHTANMGDNEHPSTAPELTLGGTALQLSAGLYHTCALLDTGYIRCWGYNGYGQLGYGNYSYWANYPYTYYNYDIGDNETPAAAGDVNTGSRVLQVSAGHSHTCALLSSGTIKCWGAGSNGRLGYGNASQQNAPPAASVDLDGATAFQVSAGGAHTCALLSTGKARCWGHAGYGQLGYGNTNDIGDNEQPSAPGDIQVLPPSP